MPSISQVTDIIINRTGIAPHIVTQSARRLREDEILPQSSGCKPAQIGPNAIALLVFASLTTQIVKDATRKALNYGALTLEGGAWDGDESGTTLQKHFAAVIDSAWTKGESKLQFKSLTLDLMNPGATVLSTFENDTLHMTFIPPDTDATEFRAVTIRREVTLTREVFLNIIGDLRKLDVRKRLDGTPFVVPRVAKRWAA
jgi:hypothetical protein